MLLCSSIIYFSPGIDYNRGTMTEKRRRSKRVELPLGVRFRTTYGARDYSPGITTNISDEGLGLAAHDFRFIVYENLELIIGLPGKGDSVALYGDVVWKRQSGPRCLAGIQLRMKDRDSQRAAMEKIFSFPSPPPPPAHRLGIVRNYNQDSGTCRVTFRLLREDARTARYVTIAGDFNNWDSAGSPMTRLENGDFVITMDLESSREYKYVYLVDGSRRQNDWYADKYARNESGVKASVVIL